MEVRNVQYYQKDYVGKQYAQIITQVGIPQEAWKCIFFFWYTRSLNSYYSRFLEIILVAVWVAVIFSAVNRISFLFVIFFVPFCTVFSYLKNLYDPLTLKRQNLGVLGHLTELGLCFFENRLLSYYFYVFGYNHI